MLYRPLNGMGGPILESRIIMTSAIKKAIKTLFDDAARSKSAMARLLNPAAEGAGGRVYPAKNAKNDKRYGIRIDKGEAVHNKPNTIRLKLQINSNAESSTLRNLAKSDPHRVVSNADVDTQQEVTKENLDKMEDDFIENLDL
ncbi:hypothetical protein BDV25DRAFT_152518 [Aspergillus avenaceus]|uniref:Uncharacterized protein n=1 Tax=Aspergillus avenaceus TaxID=36643 RepID=A0A5N6TZK5_ASPAV|nr:hypothetical protein BDV25DRAFT_152518 [Aspergillus avenaceus]